jgi:hypothetical protein
MTKKWGLVWLMVLGLSFMTNAVQVTFQVDMSGQTVSPNGVHLAGSFSDVNGDGVIDNDLPNWNPGGIALADGGNGTWSVTVELVAGLYEYKFVNGNDWSNPEFFSPDVFCAQWLNGNRSITIGDVDVTIPVVCWNQCLACGAGCIDPSNPPSIPICLVTVDVASGYNHIIWEPAANGVVQEVIVYKETNVLNVFEQIGLVDFSASGTFEDINSNPQIQANRYKIGLKDSCGFVYEPFGGIHKTIHLTTSPGLNNNINLNWSAYEGADFASYNIYRGNNVGSMNLIETVASNILSYTDINPPADEWNYMIELEGVSCNPDRALVFSRSNVLSMIPQNIQEATETRFQLFPNPTSSSVVLKMNKSNSSEQFEVHNALGELIMRDRIVSENQVINVEQLSEGIYFLKLGDSFQRLQIVR